MIFEIKSLEGETLSFQKQLFIDNFSKRYLENTFVERDYGADVQNVAILIILIKTRPGYEKWFNARKPKYIEYTSGYSLLTGEPVFWEWKKRFVIEIRFDGELFDKFIEADDEQAKCILAKESHKALDLLDKLPKRLKNFDKERFKEDVANYYKEQGWIQ